MASRRTAASPNDEIVRLIKTKAKKHARHGEFHDQEPEDLEQELHIKWLEIRAKHDSDRGSLIAFVDTALNNYLRNLVEAKRTQKRGGAGPERVSKAEQARPHPTQPPSELDPDQLSKEFDFEGTALRIDVHHALRKLRPDQRDLAIRRIHDGVTAIAKDMGLSRETIYQRIREIRGIFKELGLEEYL